MFENFTSRLIPTGRGSVFARVGGGGPPILLLHGYPQTHVMWHSVAPALAERFTVVAVDLPGYGQTFRPETAPDHRAHSKRAIGDDLVDVMGALGFDGFAVAGHDRGGRVAYRMALDHPGRVIAAAAFDVVPTGEVWSRADAQLALAYWHWAFLAQPAPLPEKLIGADPQAFFDHHVRALGLGRAPGRYHPDLMATYRAILDDPTVVHAICEDYRAGAGIDRVHDDADQRADRRITCPLLVLWSESGALPKFYGDVLAVWAPWANDIRGRGLDAGHFLVEDQPDQVVGALLALLGDAGRGDAPRQVETPQVEAPHAAPPHVEAPHAGPPHHRTPEGTDHDHTTSSARPAR
ncbi:alpha/beta fold hydrolase [Marisediminicola senii]|uniref:alpha/beta fold hydrolase n=1 Tax=Marisediminicola senii TaxID=2711233 RepID=UPI0013EE06D5|nr:alpha/beta hydrolase [Marisediminicola senii]